MHKLMIIYMKRLFITLFSLAVLAGSIAPATSFALTPVLPGQTQIDPIIPNDPSISRRICVGLDANLGVSARDRDQIGPVYRLQQYLQSLGFLKVTPTGYYGVLTLQAVKDFQRAHGVPPTGFVGPLTRAKVRAVSCGDDMPAKDLLISVRTNKDVYIQGEPITIEISAQNNTGKEQTLNWTNSCQTSYKIGSYDRLAVISCLQVLTSEKIPAHGYKTWTMTHQSSDFDLPVGTYTVEGTLLGYGSEKVIIKVVNSEADKFQVLSPNNGEVWKLGDTAEISWKGAIASDTVDIQLLPYVNCSKAPCPLMLIKPYDLAQKISAAAPYKWVVGNNLELSSGRIITAGDYKVQVCVNSTPRVCDTTDEHFTIANGSSTSSIKVTSPNGGEVWRLGESKQIRWTATVVNKDVARVNINIRPYIVCITAPCIALPVVSINNSPYNTNDPFYIYNLTTDVNGKKIEPGNYVVEVCLVGTTVCDTSDSYFKVTS
jgi:hypothetical protein